MQRNNGSTRLDIASYATGRVLRRKMADVTKKLYFCKESKNICTSTSDLRQTLTPIETRLCHLRADSMSCPFDKRAQSTSNR